MGVSSSIYQEPLKPGMGSSQQPAYKNTQTVQQPQSNKPTGFGDYYGNTRVLHKLDEEESKERSLNTSNGILSMLSLNIYRFEFKSNEQFLRSLSINSTVFTNDFWVLCKQQQWNTQGSRCSSRVKEHWKHMLYELNFAMCLCNSLYQ